MLLTVDRARALACCCAAGLGIACAPPPAPDSDPDLECAPVHVDDDLERSLYETLARCQEALGTPGAQLAVRTADGWHWTGAVGVADLESGAPMTVDTRFRVGSATKMFTAAIIMQLVEEGALDLERPLDWIAFPGGDAITVRHLLQMTGGVADHMKSERVRAELDRPWTPEELVAESAAMGPVAEPGERFHYSNTNFVLLGLLAEHVEGRPFSEILRARVLDRQPLGATRFDDGLDDQVPIAGGYWDDDGDWTDIGDTINPSALWSAGAMLSTADDLARWSQLVFTGHVLDDPSVLVGDPVPRGSSDRAYGLGTSVDRTDHGVGWGHKGRMSGHYTWVVWLPDYRLAVAATFNTSVAEVDPRELADAAVGVLVD